MASGMRLLRSTLFVISAALLALGYAASQWAYFTGTYRDYAERVDVAPVRWLALTILLACVALPFVREATRET